MNITITIEDNNTAIVDIYDRISESLSGIAHRIDPPIARSIQAELPLSDPDDDFSDEPLEGGYCGSAEACESCQ